jgi:hypothetical protein
MTVAGDSPEPASGKCTTFSAPDLGRCCSATKVITSTGVTSTGSLVTTVKNAFRSCA